jgi:subtilisin family serine protease
MRGVRTGLAAVIVAVLALPAPATASRQALVLLNRTSASNPAVRASANALLARTGLRRARPDVPQVGLTTVQIPAGTSFAQLAARLRADPAVRVVEPNYRHRLRFVPNDPAVTEQDPLAPLGTSYQWYLARQGFPAAWDLSRGGGQKVGIVDSGIDSTHPDLAGKIAIARDQDAAPTGIGDDVGHGTHVAGLACGAIANGLGIAGTGGDCSLVVEKSDLSAASVVASLVDATNQGASVINMSFGGGHLTRAELRALRYAFRHDVVLVAAAADSPTVEQGHPAKDLQPTGTGPHLSEGDGLVVTAADSTGHRASFAGRGSQISLAAYGDTGTGGAPGIFSTFPANITQIETGGTNPPSAPCPSCRAVLNGDPRYGYLSGTSMASPQVAGAIALVRAADPKLSNLSVIRLMKATATRARGWTNELGWGIVDAGAAVRGALALTADTVPPKATPRDGRHRRVGRHFKLRWRGRDTAGPGVAPAGIESYAVYARKGRGHYHLILTTQRNTVRFVGKRGSKYSFYIQARDLAGNVEPAPHAADFVIRVRRR